MALTRGKTHLGAAKLTNPSAFDPRRALTLRDVSEASGVSEMTVSRVLRNRGDVSEATREKVLQAARALNAAVSIQIEVESLDELRQALDAGAENILIDNFSLQDMRDAVAINQGRALLEASGGISLESIRAVAATGVDRISVGSITKDVKAIDFSLRVTARHDQPAG